MENIIVKLKNEYSPETMAKILQIYADELKKVNSLYVRKVNGEYIVKLNIHDNDKFNGVTLSNSVQSIVNHIASNSSDNNSIVYYVQSSLEIINEMYEPLMMALAKAEFEKWSKYIEYDDLLQICRYSLCKLYSAGYYIHKSALKQVYEHDVLLSIRKHMFRCDDVSLYQRLSDDGEGVLYDEIADTTLDNKKQDEDDRDTIEYIFETLKPVIIGIIGERRFKMLMTNVKAKSLTAADYVLVSGKLREKLKRKGYDLQWFRKKMGGD